MKLAEVDCAMIEMEPGQVRSRNRHRQKSYLGPKFANLNWPDWLSSETIRLNLMYPSAKSAFKLVLSQNTR